MKTYYLLIISFFLTSGPGLFAQCNLDDYEALRQIYLSTDGVNWDGAPDWQAMTWAASPPPGCNICILDGITCDPGSGRVTVVHLSNTNSSSGDPARKLVGSLPSQVGLLTELITFNVGNSTQAINTLSKNEISGSIPPQFDQCSQLKNLHLNNNLMTGSIPSGIFNLLDLEVLFLGGNNLIGPLSSSVSNLTNLRNLSLGYNSSFGGGIPNTISALTELRTLNMENCGMTGTIPSSIGSCVQLDQFIIRNNPNFTSTVPASMSSLPNLTVFWASNCDLNGTVPSFSGCPLMKRIHLGQNDFPGQTLPSSWGTLTDLTFIGIGSSKIVGSIPTNYGNLTLLTDFSINDNNISGTLPSQFANCTQMRVFNVFDNPQLTGALPSGYSAWNQLTRFRAYGCNFTGNVPASYSNWSNCSYFTIGGNNLNGPVPDIFGTMTNLFRVTLDSNQFTGSMPVSLAAADSLKELFIQECGLTGCFDPALDYLCGTLETYNIDAGNSFDATWSNFCSSGAGECISITPTTCTFPNNKAVNLEVDGNACIDGMMNVSDAIHLTPLVNVPNNPEAGTMYFDANTAKLRIWDGGQWRECW